MSTNFLQRALRSACGAASLLALGLAAGFPAVAAEDLRRYEDGPLTADDFREEAPASSRAAAKTVTQFAYEFRFHYRTTTRLTTATLDSITIHANIRRDQSWNTKPEDFNLLDHEQGHADIAQIHCLKARLAFRKKLGRSLTATASSPREASVALDRKVREEMAKFEQAARDADAEYDRQTVNGLGGKQAEWRRVQIETLKQLDAEWGAKKLPIIVTSE